MAKVSINIIKDWFKNQMKPPQEQFWSWLDSFWHKDEPIPQTAVKDLVTTLQKKADLVDGVVPEEQLPFSVVTSEVLALGKVSVTGNKVDLEVHSSGENKVRVKGQLITRAFPNQWTITPIVADGTKVLRGYAVRNEPDFFLAEGPELPNIEDPEIPPEALEIFKITLNAAGSTVTVPTTGYQLKEEDGWRTTLVGSTIDSIKLNYAYDKRGSFYVTKLPGTLGNVTIGGIRKSGMPENSIYDGRELLIYNATGEDLFIDSAGVDGSDSFLFSNKLTPLTVKNNSSIRVKRKDGVLELLPSGGGEGLDNSSLIDKMHSYWDATLGKLVSSGLQFVAGVVNQLEFSGRIKAKSIILPTNADAGIANELGFDGTHVFYGDTKKKLAFDGQIYKAISANTTLDDTYHNAIVWITATSTITVPSSLRNDFNCVFFVIGSFVGTIAGGSGVTFKSPYGLEIGNNASGHLARYTGNEFVFFI